jgi:hypothetical protein
LALKPVLATAAQNVRARARRLLALIKERWAALRPNL